MPDIVQPPAHTGNAEAVVIVNLGTPEAPTARAVRRFLAQFLHDHRVVQLSRWLWCPLLHGLILPLRGPRVADKYAQIWMDEGSPLAVHTRRLAEAMQARLPGARVVHAMRYGQPALADVLRDLRKDGVRRALVLPLYPQYSTTTTASVADVLAQVGKAGDGPQLRMLDGYATDPGLIQALADSVRRHWRQRGRGDRLLVSFHGIPQRLVDGGDPYAGQCRATVAALAQALQLDKDDYVMSFQSRFGREQWLQPATDAMLRELAGQGVRQVDVICPGFAVDCLETLEEISILNAGIFREAAQQAVAAQPSALSPQPSLNYIACLNDSSAHADALTTLARRELEAWI